MIDFNEKGLNLLIHSYWQVFEWKFSIMFANIFFSGDMFAKNGPSCNTFHNQFLTYIPLADSLLWKPEKVVTHLPTLYRETDTCKYNSQDSMVLLHSHVYWWSNCDFVNNYWKFRFEDNKKLNRKSTCRVVTVTKYRQLYVVTVTTFANVLQHCINCLMNFKMNFHW